MAKEDTPLDQAVFDSTLEAELAKGTDRRVAEGRARSAAVRTRITGDPVAVRGRCRLIDASTTRIVMFGGKGGVGKTTAAAAAALDTARRHPRRRILLLSADPAHSLSDVLGVTVADVAAPLGPTTSNLHVREIDPSAAFRRVREQYASAIDRDSQRPRDPLRIGVEDDRAGLARRLAGARSASG